MTRRLAALMATLALAGACRAPTAPDALAACSFTVTAFNPQTRVCYTPCPPDAESVARAYAFGYSPTDQCTVTPP